MDLIEATHLTKRLSGRLAVDDVSFQLQHGSQMGLIGETGSGKSTLLKMIAGLLTVDKGGVTIDGERVLGPDEKLLPGHPSIGYLSQFFELRNHYRVEEELDYSNLMDEGEALELFTLCKIDHLLPRWTSEVSGGERQRIVLAKKLIARPSLLLLDEPFSNLDLIHKNILKKVLLEVKNKLDLTIVIASHDPQDILSWADHVLVMRSGSIVDQGSPFVLYHQPASIYVASLLGPINIVSEHVAMRLGLTNRFSSAEFFLRPERIRINTVDAEGVDAGVMEIKFAGSFYLISVLILEEVVVVSTTCCEWKVGDKIKIMVR